MNRQTEVDLDFITCVHHEGISLPQPWEAIVICLWDPCIIPSPLYLQDSKVLGMEKLLPPHPLFPGSPLVLSALGSNK